MTTCTHCETEIERGPLLMRGGYAWIETRSGDDGGTYDFCPESPDERHRPVAL
jgi:hypothetical protein